MVDARSGCVVFVSRPHICSEPQHGFGGGFVSIIIYLVGDEEDPEAGL